jgi:DNA modification methylase
VNFDALRESYLALLRSKIPQAEVAGFTPFSAPHASLFPHQVDVALWMIKGGRRAGFLQFGLGKTRIHLQVGWWVAEKTGGKYLIICPLGVRQEFTQNDGPAMGYPVYFVRTSEEVRAIKGRIFVTNYESVRDGKIDLSLFAGAGLDEASVLRSYGSKTYQEFLPMFKAVKYRYVFTATPSPNRYKELIHYGAFLGIMDSGEALTRFFQRDSEKAGNLTLYPHMEAQFWAWLHSWACFMTRPSDLGYSDEGYDLPPIQIHWHRLEVDQRAAWAQVDTWGQAQLLRDDAQGLRESAEIKRESIDMRVSAAADIMDAEVSTKHWLIWHDLEKERAAIEKAIPEAKTVYGTQELDIREDLIMAFSRGEFSILATKPIIAGSGCNFQKHCADAIFLGVGYKFNDFIQAIHRIHRFQQKEQVNIHIVHLDSEDAIVAELKAKWKRHDELMLKMQALLKLHKLTSTNTMELYRNLNEGTERAEVQGERFRVIHNDVVLELLSDSIPDNSVDHICTSIPFGNQYEYSPSFNDFGHNSGDAGFFEQMGHLCPQLLRVLKPGRIAAIHVKDRIQFGNVTGHASATVNPFSDKTVKAFMDAGFVFMARITIDTDVVRENAQTYRLGWSENAKDSTKMGAGMPEYVLIFRKLPSDLSNAYADEPVTKPKEDYTRADWQLDASGLWRSNGNRLPDPDIMVHWSMEDIKRWWIEHSLQGGYSHPEHATLAKALEERGKLPSSFMLFPAVSRHADIWTDITRMRTLNSEQSRRAQEKHVCPLQLDIIKRLITRYTNKDDLVFDPFLGIGSTAYQALKMGRRALGTELNLGYWKDAVGYCEVAERDMTAPTLFDLAAFETQPGALAA